MNDQQIKKLKLFHERVERLKQNSDFFVNLSLNLKYDRDKGKGVDVIFKGPDHKTIKSLLLDFRPFIANNEPVNFNHISNLIERHISDRVLIATLRDIKNAWSTLMQKKDAKPIGGLILKLDNVELLSEKNIDLWINGEYFHLDQDKRQVLKKYVLIQPFAFFVFLDVVQRLCMALFWLDEEVVSEILKEH